MTYAFEISNLTAMIGLPQGTVWQGLTARCRGSPAGFPQIYCAVDG
jgi:hypothetical protein